MTTKVTRLTLAGLLISLLAACTQAPSLAPVVQAPAPAVQPTVPPPAPVTPSPAPTTAYPAGWVKVACGALGSLTAAVSARDDLATAAAANDYYAIGKTGGSIALAAYEAYTAMETIPDWPDAAAFVTQMQAATGTMVDAGSFLKEGGENASPTTVERGLTNFDVAIDTATNAAGKLQALSTQYGFDCRG